VQNDTTPRCCGHGVVKRNRPGPRPHPVVGLSLEETELARSWGTRELREYAGPDGALSRVHLQRGKAQATLELDSRWVTRIQSFDGLSEPSENTLGSRLDF
jgi:hypothetical protein